MKKIYFKLSILTLSILLSHSTKAQEYILNGGLEYGYTNWTNTISSGADGYMDLIFTDDAREGSIELEIHLEDKAGDNYAVGSSTFAQVGNDSIYLLRFWARESKEFVFNESEAGYDATPDFARMLVTIEGESGKTQEVLYKFRQGMTTFHLPFKTKDKNLKITFYPQTEGRSYYIDGVELLDQNNDKNMDVLYTYIWNNKRSTTEGTWVAGDNDVSFLLPDGRTIWVFNDSFYGDVNDTTVNALERTGGFIRNAMVVEDVDGTITGWGTSDSNNNGQSAFFETVEEIVDAGGGQKNFYWVGDMLMEDGMVKVHLIELDETGGLHDTRRSYIAELSYPELELQDIKKQASFCFRFETFFVDNDTIYLYKGGETERGEEAGTHVARTPLGNLIGAEMWEFWNGSEWVKDSAQSVSVYPNSPDGVIKLEDGSYAHVSGMSALSMDIYIGFAPAPEGPWTTPQRAYTRPDDWKYWAYMPNFHRQLPNKNYSISYSSNGWLPLFWSTWSFADKYWYRQRYIQLDLLDMSPYSTGYDCAGVQGGSAYLDDCNECVGGTTGLEPCLSGIAILYDDTDFGGTAVGLEVGDYTLQDLIDAGFTDDALSSLEIEDGYTIELYENDNFEGNSIQLQSETLNLSDQSFDNMTSSIIIHRTGTDAISGTFIIQNKLTELVMGTSNGSKNKGSKIVQTAFTDSTTQYFTFDYKGHGYYTITNEGIDDLVSIMNSSTEEDAFVNTSSGLNITSLNGTITAQYYDSPDGEGIDNLIDNNSETKYLTFNSTAWVQYQADEAYVISEYSLTSANDAAGRDPLNWTLSASNDGTNWTVIDEVSDQDFPDRYQEIYFPLPDNSTAYSFYKLDMEANPGYILQLAEWKLIYKDETMGEFDNELFVLKDNGEAYYTIYNKGSDLLLGVFNNNKYLPGTFVKQLMDFGQESAQWKLIPAADTSSLSVDCAGIIGGEAQEDECGWCYGGKTGEEACVPEYDCNDDLFGDAYYDDCDRCVGGNTGREPCVISIEESLVKDGIILYPNPVRNELTVSLNSAWEGEKITIYNIQGVAVWSGLYDSSTIDLSSLKSGIYILHIANQNDLINVRFIKQ